MGNMWQGQKIKLRAVEVDDAEDFFSIDDFDTDLQRLCDRIHFPVSRAQVRQHVEKMAQSSPANDEFTWIIESMQGKAVGNINVFQCEKRNGTFKYGVGIKKGYWGQGYATEAIMMVLTYYFRELRYQKVNVHIYAFNERSIRLHEKLGFKKEGVLRRMVYTQGQFHDEVHLGLTSEEFDALYSESVTGCDS